MRSTDSLGVMHFGLALPQYDYSVAGERPLRFATIVEYAQRASGAGFDSVWLSDHLFLDLAKYGGAPDREACYEPVVTLAALARRVPELTLGALVFCEALRPASVLAKSLATLDRLGAARLDIGLGAGWYEPEYEAIGMSMPSPGTRLRRLGEAIAVVKGLLPGDEFTFEGETHRASAARVMPPARTPRPRVFVGGKGDRLLRLIAERADGWNTCWTWTTDAYRERADALARACETVGRDPATVWRSLGLYALCGEDERDLARRFEQMAATAPHGVMRGVDLAGFRAGRLVGTVEQIRDQVAQWEDLGVDTIIAGVGAVPFHTSSMQDVEMLGSAFVSA
jgi:alkanesulfonate monooxygenase SsuD/methylene tetrahydromethanopterin reductase-like flavin-dependent oxidoreductase (luciferase family)